MPTRHAQEDIASRAAQRELAGIAASAAAARLAAQHVAPPTQVAQPDGAGAPVAGHILQAYGAATVAGPAQGISYGAAPGARVTAPCAGTVLFAGAFPAYGHVVIAGCGAGTSVVLAGMATARRRHRRAPRRMASRLARWRATIPPPPPANRSFMSNCGRTARRSIPSPWLAHGHF